MNSILIQVHFILLESQQTMGVLEVGGASAQITFLPEVDPLADKFPVQVLGKDYSVYTHSYLGYAQDALVRWIDQRLSEKDPDSEILESPCMLLGEVSFQAFDLY